MESSIDYGLLQYLRNSGRAREILSYLQRVRPAKGSILMDDSVDSKVIARSLRIQQTNTIKYLRDLLNHQAVDEVTSRKRGRRFRITPKGLTALDVIAKE